jgi:archaellum biogenesis ATPase FlaH
MTPDLQLTIINNLVLNETYMRRVIPFIKQEYFEGIYGTLFAELTQFVGKYNKLPTQDALKIELDDSNINEQDYQESIKLLPIMFDNTNPVDTDWLIDKTEKWCQDRAVFLAIMESIEIIDGKRKTQTRDALPEILKNALAVSFDTNIGHDYFVNFEDRFDFYHLKEDRIPFDLDYFNRITKGGLPNKTLNIALAGTGVGKSLFMCHVAASALSQGHDVLYITMEMAEERVAERIDANLMNVPIDQLENMTKNMFSDRVSSIAKKTKGKLIIKEYPTGSAHTGNFRALLKELELKKSFKPEIIFIDYLNICASSRIRGLGNSINTYSLIKSIAEELRGLAVEFNVPIFSATQTTRAGFTNSDPGLEDTSESFGLPATADLMFALVSNEELEKQGQLMIKQLKNRYADPSNYKRFTIGIDRSKMKLFDVDESDQDLMEDEDTGPVFDKTTSGKKLSGIKFN